MVFFFANSFLEGGSLLSGAAEWLNGNGNPGSPGLAQRRRHTSIGPLLAVASRYGTQSSKAQQRWDGLSTIQQPLPLPHDGSCHSGCSMSPSSSSSPRTRRLVRSADVSHPERNPTIRLYTVHSGKTPQAHSRRYEIGGWLPSSIDPNHVTITHPSPSKLPARKHVDNQRKRRVHETWWIRQCDISPLHPPLFQPHILDWVADSHHRY